MATTAMDYENANGDRFEDDPPRYDRDRSASPRRDDGPEPAPRRSASPNGNERAPAKDDTASKDDDSINPGSNLFVTGIHPRLNEEQVTRLFEKYGEVEKCQIMRDPHTGESRGFGFVKMVTSEQADAAREGLQNEVIEGRTLSIEKARRSRPRTPTPGKYFGPPKRDGRGGGRFDDRRSRGGYGGGSRDDSYRSGGYRGYREDRGYERGYYDRGYRDDRGYERGGGGGGGGGSSGYREDRYEREDRGYRGYDRRSDRGDDAYGSRVDRYQGGREERYGGARGGGDERRGGAGYERERFDRPADRDGGVPRDAGPPAGGYSDSAPRGEARESYGGR